MTEETEETQVTEETEETEETEDPEELTDVEVVDSFQEVEGEDEFPEVEDELSAVNSGFSLSPAPSNRDLNASAFATPLRRGPSARQTTLAAISVDRQDNRRQPTSSPATSSGTIANMRQRVQEAVDYGDELQDRLSWTKKQLGKVQTYCETLHEEGSKTLEENKKLRSENKRLRSQLAAEKLRAEQAVQAHASLLETQNRDLSMLLRYQVLGNSRQLPSLGGAMSFDGPAQLGLSGAGMFSPPPVQAPYPSVPRYGSPARGWQSPSSFFSEPPSAPYPSARSPSAAPAAAPASSPSRDARPPAPRRSSLNRKFEWPTYENEKK